MPAHAAPVRRPRDGCRRRRRPAARCSGTASGSTPTPTRPSRARSPRRPARIRHRHAAAAVADRAERERRCDRRPARPRRARAGTARPRPQDDRHEDAGAHRGARDRPRMRGEPRVRHAGRAPTVVVIAATRAGPGDARRHAACRPRAAPRRVRRYSSAHSSQRRALLDCRGRPSPSSHSSTSARLRRVEPPGRLGDPHRPPGGLGRDRSPWRRHPARGAGARRSARRWWSLNADSKTRSPGSTGSSSTRPVTLSVKSAGAPAATHARTIASISSRVSTSSSADIVTSDAPARSPSRR